MFAFSSAKVHFFFEICKRKIIFPQNSSISCLFQTSLEKEKEKEKKQKEKKYKSPTSLNIDNSTHCQSNIIINCGIAITIIWFL